MESAKPLEPGCLALVIAVGSMCRHLYGETVLVKEHVGFYAEQRGKRTYTIKDGWKVEFKGEGYISETTALLRIDDPDIQKQLVAEDQQLVRKYDERIRSEKNSLPDHE